MNILMGFLIGLIVLYFIIVFWAYFLHRNAIKRNIDSKIGRGTFKQFKYRFDMLKWETYAYDKLSMTTADSYRDKNGSISRLGRVHDSEISFKGVYMLLGPFAYFNARLYVIYKIYQMKKLDKIPRWEELESEEIFDKITE